MSVTQNSGTAVALLLLGALVVAVVYDVAAGASGGKLDTVTAVLRDWSRAYPILPFAVGVLVGHLFW